MDIKKIVPAPGKNIPAPVPEVLVSWELVPCLQSLGNDTRAWSYVAESRSAPKSRGERSVGVLGDLRVTNVQDYGHPLWTG